MCLLPSLVGTSVVVLTAVGLASKPTVSFTTVVPCVSSLSSIPLAFRNNKNQFQRELQHETVFLAFAPAGAATERDTDQLPSVEQCATDAFGKQVKYASQLVPLLLLDSSNKNNNDDGQQLRKRLEAQFSHADGIRGFFVTYLTMHDDENSPSSSSPATTAAALPSLLQSVLDQTLSDDNDDLISLSFMNVIMPTAVASMHTQPELQQSSLQTAQKGRRVLDYLATTTATSSQQTMKATCRAILQAVAELAETNEIKQQATADDNAKQVDYWKRFMTGYGYGQQQRMDIAKQINQVLDILLQH